MITGTSIAPPGAKCGWKSSRRAGGLRRRGSRLTVGRRRGEPSLQRLGEFLGESAARRSVLVRAFLPAARRALVAGPCSIPGSGRLRLVGAQQTVLQGCSVEPANNGLHLVAIRRLDESEASGLLSFRIPDDLDAIGHQAVSDQPRHDIVGCDPGRKVSKKDSMTHFRYRLLHGDRGNLCERENPSNDSILPHGPVPRQTQSSRVR